MKGIVLLLVATLSAIAIGVGVEAAQGAGVPSPLLSAIVRTETAASVDLRFESPRAGATSIVTEEYNAPNRLEMSIRVPSDDPLILIGGTGYFKAPHPLIVGGNLSTYFSYAVGGHPSGGMSIEKAREFASLVVVMDSGRFEKTTSGYAFRAFNTIVERPKVQNGGSGPTFVINEVGGTLSLADGYVSRLTLDEVVDGKASSETLEYGNFDHAQTITRPRHVEPCGSTLRAPLAKELCEDHEAQTP